MYRNNKNIQIFKKIMVLIIVVLIFNILLSCKSSPNYNQENTLINNKSIDINANWKKGDKKIYELTSINHIPQIINKSIIKIEVIDVSENVNKIRWTKKPKNTTSLNETLFSGSLLNLFKNGLIIEYNTNKNGEIFEVTNFIELNKTINEIRDYTIEQIIGIQELPEDQKYKLIQIINKKIDIDNYELILEDIFLFHSLYGQKYELNKNINYKTELPSGIGDALVPVDVNAVYDFVDSDTFRIFKDEVYDSKVFGEISRKASKGIIPEHIANEINWTDIYAKNNLEFDININTTWPKRIQSIREIEKQGNMQRKTYLLTEK